MITFLADINTHNDYVTLNLWNILVVLAIVALIVYILRRRRF